MTLFLILLLAVFQCSVTNYLIENPDYYQLGPYVWESDDFRAMKLGRLAEARDVLDYDMLTTLMIEHDYDLTELKDTRYNNVVLMAARPADYRKLKHAYEMVLGDMRYFPVPQSLDKSKPDVKFENGWMDARSYVSGGEPDGGEADAKGNGQAGTGGYDQNEKSRRSGAPGEVSAGEDKTNGENNKKRRHEGCDIMGSDMPRGYYPIVSMTDGTVERIGWLEMGGWRIGVRAPGGAYIYYAHLYSYARDFKEGEQVRAGELLGYMGDTGYGKQEGTRGNFDVHLHVGIYIKTDHYQELSVNPYWILKYLEKHRLTFTY